MIFDRIWHRLRNAAPSLSLWAHLDALFNKHFSVLGDANVKVCVLVKPLATYDEEFSLSWTEEAEYHWSVYLLGSIPDVERYTMVVVEIPGLQCKLVAAVDFDVAVLDFDTEAVRAFRASRGIVHLWIETAAGELRPVVSDV